MAKESILSRIEQYLKRPFIGYVEKVKLEGLSFTARVDSGAAICSIDTATYLKLYKKDKVDAIRMMQVKNPGSKQHTVRPVVMIEIELKGEKHEVEFNVNDRTHMSFPVLLGRNLLQYYIIDPHRQKYIPDEW